MVSAVSLDSSYPYGTGWQGWRPGQRDVGAGITEGLSEGWSNMTNPKNLVHDAEAGVVGGFIAGAKKGAKDGPEGAFIAGVGGAVVSGATAVAKSFWDGFSQGFAKGSLHHN